jgi:hypothetical protein
MSLRSPPENETEACPSISNLRGVRHSRMLLAGIQAEFGLDPRLKHSGVTPLGVASLTLAAIFEGGHPYLFFPACGEDQVRGAELTLRVAVDTFRAV